MKAWITKYALTSGIIEVNDAEESGDMICYKHGSPYVQYAHGEDWWTNFEVAKNRAEQMRQAKIASLKKQIAKLEKLEF